MKDDDTMEDEWEEDGCVKEGSAQSFSDSTGSGSLEVREVSQICKKQFIIPEQLLEQFFISKVPFEDNDSVITRNTNSTVLGTESPSILLNNNSIQNISADDNDEDVAAAEIIECDRGFVSSSSVAQPIMVESPINIRTDRLGFVNINHDRNVSIYNNIPKGTTLGDALAIHKQVSIGDIHFAGTETYWSGVHNFRINTNTNNTFKIGVGVSDITKGEKNLVDNLHGCDTQGNIYRGLQSSISRNSNLQPPLRCTLDMETGSLTVSSEITGSSETCQFGQGKTVRPIFWLFWPDSWMTIAELNK